MEDIMKTKQSGFTLVELAIVLVIVGLLIGGILKGQELINSGKVKGLAADLRNIPVAYNGYQDKYRALPGDDKDVASHTGLAEGTGTNQVTKGNGDGVLGGVWDDTGTSAESVLFWQHVRAAGLFPGTTMIAADKTYWPNNALGERIGITATNPTTNAAFKATYYLCSDAIPGKLARELDAALDDGVGTTGSVQAFVHVAAPAGAKDVAAYDDTKGFTVCIAQ